MTYSSKQNKNDSGLEWDDPDPCVGLRGGGGGGHEPLFYPSYYMQSLSHSQEAPENKFLQSSTVSSYRSPCIRYDDNNAYALCVNPWGCSKKLYRARMPNEEDEDEEKEENVCCGYSYVPTSWMCICLQVILWSLVTMGVFIVLFSIATRPRSPGLSVKKIACRNFRVGEGSDKSGVPTKVLSCSCNVSLDIDNRSEFFGVHVRPAYMTMAFADLTIATGHGREVYVDKDSTMRVEVEARARRKAVYGAGPSMAHLLQSGKGLPLLVRISMESSIRVVWGILNPNYSHHVFCHVLVDGSAGQHHLKLSQSQCLYNGAS